MGQSKETRESGERRGDDQRIIGDYELIRRLGRGGFSTVYLARHRILSRWSRVALKHLHTPLDSPEAREQFSAETRLLEQLSHPHILPLLDAGIDQDEFPYLVTPYAAGGSLRQRLRRAGGHPLPIEELVQIISQIGAALQYAHGRGVIHRDLKPENILFDADGQALLADFGMALLLSSRSLEAVSLSGTPAYMAPEQFRGQVGRASDQYALACIAYELSTGRRVFDEQEPLALMRCHVEEDPEPPRRFNPHLPPAVEAAILRGLAKEREARYPSVGDFVAALLAGAGALVPPQPQAAPAWKGAIWGEPAAQAVPGAGGATQMLPDESEAEHKPEWLGLANLPRRAAVQRERQAEGETRRQVSQRETWWRFPHLRRLQARRELPGTGEGGQEPGLSMPPALRDQSAIRPALPEPSRKGLKSVVHPFEGAAPSTRSLGRPQGKKHTTVQRRRGLLLVSSAAVVLALLTGLVVAYADPLALGPLGAALPIGSPLATVRITPASVLLTRQYLITAVLQTPSAALRQIQARRLSATLRSPAKTVQATGHGMTPATQAHGTITFFNEAGVSQTVPQGTLFNIAKANLSVVTDETVTIAPVQDLNNPPSATAKAHVIQPGAAGNLPARAIDNWCCSSELDIWARSSAFTGGQDPQPYTYIQRSDIDNVANPLKASLLQQAQGQIQQQARSGERLVGPDCSTAINSNHQVGDHASSATITVSATCSAEAYNQQAALDMATTLLQQEAARDPGPAYALAGQISSTIIDASLADPQSGRLIITVKAQGRWTYRFNEGAQQHLIQVLAGKSRSQALQLLQRQPGVSQADINIVRSNNDQLPDNPALIAVIIENSS
uniref:non-specific serine/threonine protein kinase n=1 Tax=Thermogemmatispora argillosa TaxID=2045280 RepID=A0A455T982_9CHLR|nr:hypothetical protein KTA_41990 [Thermogemmatispora argillosa]